jgi:hypothetical protein
VDFRFSGKSAPVQFFVDQLIALSASRDNAPLYVYLFTDHERPIEVINQLKQAVKLLNIRFDCRTTPVKDCVIADLFSMMNFNCIIRPASSHFSQIGSAFGSFEQEIFPETFHWEKDKEDRYYYVVDKVAVKKASS